MSTRSSQPEVVKWPVVKAVLEYYRNPLQFELDCIQETTYNQYREQWDEILTQRKETPRCPP